IFAGFSFGAAVGLRVACPDDRVRALIGLGTPVSPIDDRNYDYTFLQSCRKPKLFVSGTRDQFAPKAKLQAIVDTLPEPNKLVFHGAGELFLGGRGGGVKRVFGGLGHSGGGAKNLNQFKPVLWQGLPVPPAARPSLNIIPKCLLPPRCAMLNSGA